MAFGNLAQMFGFGGEQPQGVPGGQMQHPQMQEQAMAQQAQQQMMQQAAAAQQQAQAAQQQVMGQQQPQQPQQAQQGFGEGLLERFENPLVSAALGAGGSLLASADRGEGIGAGLRAGVLGAGGGFAGAVQNRKKKRQDEEQRKRLLQILTQGYGEVADDSTLPNLSLYREMLGTLG